MADEYKPQDRVPLPPANAKVVTTACDYCIVACGYKVYTWPDGEEGGPKAEQNALGLDYPVGPGGGWISPNQHNFAMIDGRRHHVVVMADPDAALVPYTAGGIYDRWTGHVIPGVQQNFDQQTRELDQEKRKALVQEAGRIMLEDDTVFAGISWRQPHWPVEERIQGFTGYHQNSKHEHIWCDPAC